MRLRRLSGLRARGDCAEHACPLAHAWPARVARPAPRADEFRTPSISAVRVEWRAGARSAPHRDQHPAGDRFPLHLCRPAPGAGWDPRSTPALVQLNAINARRSSPGSDAARCRCCCRSTPPAISKPGRRRAEPVAVALSGRLPSRRPVPRRPGRLRRGVFAASPAPATACRRGPSPGRSKCRSPARS